MNYKKLNTWLKFDEGGKVFTKNMDGYTIYLGNYPYFILNISCFSIPLEGKVSKAQVEQITEASLKNECFVTSFDGKNDISRSKPILRKAPGAGKDFCQGCCH